jgi:hypothetical protein
VAAATSDVTRTASCHNSKVFQACMLLEVCICAARETDVYSPPAHSPYTVQSIDELLLSAARHTHTQQTPPRANHDKPGEVLPEDGLGLFD